MTLDWIHVAMAIVGAVATILYNRLGKPQPTPVPSPSPEPAPSGHPILDAVLAILKQLADQPITAVSTSVVHGAATTRVTINKEENREVGAGSPSGNR